MELAPTVWRLCLQIALQVSRCRHVLVTDANIFLSGSVYQAHSSARPSYRPSVPGAPTRRRPSSTASSASPRLQRDGFMLPEDLDYGDLKRC